jgi:hypothetical protein
MSADEALANLTAYWFVGGGDTGRGRVEHRSFAHITV